MFELVESVNTTRISGLASGMDTEKIVSDLMKAERMPLTKLEQDKTWTTWQRDAYRDINKTLLDLDNSILNMKLQSTYSPKTTSSTNSAAITASAASSAPAGNYQLEVNSLATAAINVSRAGISGATNIDPDKKLSDQDFAGGTAIPPSFKFYTFNEEGVKKEHTVTIGAEDSLNDVLGKISTASNKEVRAFYDSTADKVVLERAKTGNFNTTAEFEGAEIGFDSTTTGASFLTDILQLTAGVKSGTETSGETGGSNAEFKYNGALALSSFSNSYTLNNVTFNFTSTTTSPVNVTVSNDIDSAVDKIVGFVNKYNEMIEKVNDQLAEPRYRDFRPLTEQQKEGMSEKEIELWEEKAKSGLLRSDNMLTAGLFNMRQDWYGEVDNSGSYTHLSQIGIKTSSNYRDGGKLLITEDKLREALRKDPEAVHKLFSNDVEGDGRGIINRLEDSIENTMTRIEERAGKGTQTLEQYTMGKRLKNMDNRIDNFEDRLVQVEDRYWRQFTAMEKAIQRLNQQSMYLMQQFG